MKKILLLLISILTLVCVSLGTIITVSASEVDPVFDSETCSSEITLENANAEGSILKKSLDFWNNSTITFTEEGVVSTATATNGNLFNLIGLFPVKGKVLELELNIPLRDKTTGNFVSENKQYDNLSLVFCKGTTGATVEVAKITIWGNSYRTYTDYVTANIFVNPLAGGGYSYMQEGIQISKKIMEVGGGAKIGLSLDDGFYFESPNGYQALTMNSDYKDALDAIGIEEVTRIQVLKGSYPTHSQDYPTAIIKSVNGQSFIPENGKIKITDLWQTSKIKLRTNKFIVGANYTFSLNSTGGYNSVTSDLQPSDAYMQLFTKICGDVGWNEKGVNGSNTQSGIYVLTTNPNGEVSKTYYGTSWGHPGSQAINFSFNKYGENKLTIIIATNQGYVFTEEIIVYVEPKFDVKKEISITENGFILPQVELVSDTEGTIINADIASSLWFGETEIAENDGVYPLSGVGKYIVKYQSEYNGKTYTFEYEYFYDGNDIMSQKITPNFIFTDNAVFQQGKKIKIFGEGGNPNTTVTVNYNGQTKTGITDGEKWEVYLDEMDYNDGETLTITYGGQIIKYENVAVGEVFLCSGQSNMQITVNYIWAKNSQVGQEYTSLGDDFSGVSVFLVPSAKSSTKEDALSAIVSWEQLSDIESTGRYSAYAISFAQNLSKMTGIKVGVIVSAVGGSAIEQWLETSSFSKVANNANKLGKNASELFNTMINPILNYEIGGVLFYQGETNAGAQVVGDYLNQQLEYIDSYREMFRDENLPFVITQLVQWNGSYSFADCRTSQWQVMFERENVYTMSAIDTGDATNNDDNIHPADKWKVGQKAAGLVVDKILNIAYDDLLVKSYYGVAPYFESATVENGVLTINIANAKTLTFGAGSKVLQVYYNNAWHDSEFTVEGNNLLVNTNGANITKVKYLQVKIAPEGTAFIYNEYNNAIAPCGELLISNGTFGVSVGTVLNGTVSITPNGKVVAGTLITVTATANNGYQLKEIKVNGVVIQGNTFILDKDSVVTAIFEEITVTPPQENPPEQPEQPSEQPTTEKGCGASLSLTGLSLFGVLGFAFVTIKKKK